MSKAPLLHSPHTLRINRRLFFCLKGRFPRAGLRYRWPFDWDTHIGGELLNQTARSGDMLVAISSARCVRRAGLDRFQFLHNRSERASNGLIVDAQLLRTSDNGRHYLKYRNNSLMVGIVFGIFGLASRSPRLKVDHVIRHRHCSTRPLLRPRPSRPATAG
jgi:hypothetical protein